MIPFEVTGIHSNAAKNPRQAEPDYAPVETRRPPPPRLPAVHPLSGVGVLAFDEDRLAGLEEVFLRGEELVVGENHGAAQPLGCKINQINKFHHNVSRETIAPRGRRGKPAALIDLPAPQKRRFDNTVEDLPRIRRQLLPVMKHRAVHAEGSLRIPDRKISIIPFLNRTLAIVKTDEPGRGAAKPLSQLPQRITAAPRRSPRQGEAELKRGNAAPRAKEIS